MSHPSPDSSGSEAHAMATSRQYELTDLSFASAQRRLQKDYSPPEVAANFVLPPPSSPNPASDVSTDTRSSRRSHDSDIVDAQLQYAVHGLTSQLSPSESYTSSLASTALSAPPAGGAAVPSAAREELFRACLGGASVDVDELRRLVWAHGMPDAAWARPMAWKLLVEYLPPDRVYWDRVLSGRRANFWALVADVTVDPTDKPLNEGDHPLSDNSDSQWREYFEDTDLRTLIRRDVDRTHPDLHRMGRLRDSLERVLFVYAKVHPELKYRQGMNELAAPFLLVFSEERGADLSDVEADAYFCFDIVMTEMKLCYALVETETDGIERQLREFQALFRIKDPQLERHFGQLKIETRFYALRWLRLWLAQEFSMPELLALWDSFLTSEQRLGWVRYVCVAMLIRIRESLLAADFVDCMKLLLHYPPCDVSEILRTADRLRTSNVVIVRKAKR